MSRCFLRQFAPDGYRRCEGPPQKHHAIKRQTIRRLFPRLPLRATDDEVREHERRLNAALRDERVIWVCCRRHHDLHEKAKRIPLRRDEIPPELEAFAEEYGLVYELDRQFGAREGAA